MGRIYKTDVIELKKSMIDAGFDKIIDLSDASGIDCFLQVLFTKSCR